MRYQYITGQLVSFLTPISRKTDVEAMVRPSASQLYLDSTTSILWNEYI
jgi:hypothetical protein